MIFSCDVDSVGGLMDNKLVLSIMYLKNCSLDIFTDLNHCKM